MLTAACYLGITIVELLLYLVITKDGVTVAESVVLYDPVENIGATLIKEAARNTVKDRKSTTV